MSDCQSTLHKSSSECFPSLRSAVRPLKTPEGCCTRITWSPERACLYQNSRVLLPAQTSVALCSPSTVGLTCPRCFLPAYPQSLTPRCSAPRSCCMPKACRVTSGPAIGTLSSPKLQPSCPGHVSPTALSTCPACCSQDLAVGRQCLPSVPSITAPLTRCPLPKRMPCVLSGERCRHLAQHSPPEHWTAYVAASSR